MSRLTAMAEPRRGRSSPSSSPSTSRAWGASRASPTRRASCSWASQPRATAVVNLDDPLVVEQAQRAPGRRGSPSAAPPEPRCASCRSSRAGKAASPWTIELPAAATHRVPLGFVGEHNALNATGGLRPGHGARLLGPRSACEGWRRARPTRGGSTSWRRPGADRARRLLQRQPRLDGARRWRRRGTLAGGRARGGRAGRHARARARARP